MSGSAGVPPARAPSGASLFRGKAAQAGGTPALPVRGLVVVPPALPVRRLVVVRAALYSPR
jgi:hypothetical protein